MKTDGERDLERRDDVEQIIREREFEWPVSIHGYEWVEWVETDIDEKGEWVPAPYAEKVRALKHKLGPDGKPAFRFYAPLLENELFLAFAETPLTEDGVLAFANRWGLVSAASEARHDPDGSLRVWDQPDSGLPVDFRFDRISCVRDAVALWQCLLAGDQKKLLADEFLGWGEKDNREGWVSLKVFGDGLVFPILADDGTPCTRKQLVEAGWSVLYDVMNYYMKQLRVVLVRDKASGKVRFRVEPLDLEDAIWLQFGRAITGELKHRQCKVCQKWITIEGGKFRIDRQICSVACRQKDHRRKVKEARALRAKGRTVRQIAKHFNSQPETIKNWLKKRT